MLIVTAIIVVTWAFYRQKLGTTPQPFVPTGSTGRLIMGIVMIAFVIIPIFYIYTSPTTVTAAAKQAEAVNGPMPIVDDGTAKTLIYANQITKNTEPASTIRLQNFRFVIVKKDNAGVWQQISMNTILPGGDKASLDDDVMSPAQVEWTSEKTGWLIGQRSDKQHWVGESVTGEDTIPFIGEVSKELRASLGIAGGTTVVVFQKWYVNSTPVPGREQPKWTLTVGHFGVGKNKIPVW